MVQICRNRRGFISSTSGKSRTSTPGTSETIRRYCGSLERRWTHYATREALEPDAGFQGAEAQLRPSVMSEPKEPKPLTGMLCKILKDRRVTRNLSKSPSITSKCLRQIAGLYGRREQVWRFCMQRHPRCRITAFYIARLGETITG